MGLRKVDTNKRLPNNSLGFFTTSMGLSLYVGDGKWVKTNKNSAWSTPITVEWWLEEVNTEYSLTKIELVDIITKARISGMGTARDIDNRRPPYKTHEEYVESVIKKIKKIEC